MLVNLDTSGMRIWQAEKAENRPCTGQTYLEKRFKMRPVGVVSKNDIGLLNLHAILADSSSHSLRFNRLTLRAPYLRAIFEMPAINMR